jgi:hypothetical protein
MKLENKMLSALTKCEEKANVDPPKSDILYSTNFNASTTSNTDESLASSNTFNPKSRSLLIQNGMINDDNPLTSNVVPSNGTTATAISCMPTLSGMPRFSIDIDQQLSNDHLTIVKKKLELQTIQRRLTYIADFYYRELLGTISWAKDLPGKLHIKK